MPAAAAEVEDMLPLAAPAKSVGTQPDTPPTRAVRQQVVRVALVLILAPVLAATVSPLSSITCKAVDL